MNDNDPTLTRKCDPGPPYASRNTHDRCPVPCSRPSTAALSDMSGLGARRNARTSETFRHSVPADLPVLRASDVPQCR